MTTQEYREHPALNFSLAKHLLTSPAHFQVELNTKREATSAMHIGTIAHAMILEGKDIMSEYAIRPEGLSMATKEGKAWKAEQTLPIITEEEAVTIKGMAEAVSQNNSAMGILNNCQFRETPMFATIYGVECKALLDCHGNDRDQWVICDLKTTVDASPRGFAKSTSDMHYDLQAAWYSTILAKNADIDTNPYWYWIAVEKKPPYLNVVYESESWMEGGMKKLEKVLKKYKECTSSGKWELPYNGIQQFDKPYWA